MSSATIEILWTQIECPQRLEIFRSSTGKLVQQLFQRLAPNLPLVSLAIKFLKRSGLAELQDHPGSRHPVGALPMNQVPDYLTNGPRVLPFIPFSPRLL